MLLRLRAFINFLALSIQVLWTELFAFCSMIPLDGTVITNLAPSPRFPSSIIVMPVMDRISLERNRPKPCFLSMPLVKIFFFISAEMPTPLSSLLDNVSVINDVPEGSTVFADPLIVKVFHNLIRMRYAR